MKVSKSKTIILSDVPVETLINELKGRCPKLFLLTTEPQIRMVVNGGLETIGMTFAALTMTSVRSMDEVKSFPPGA